MITNRQRVRQQLQFAPAIVLDHVADDRALIDQRVHFTALQRLAGLDHEGIEARLQTPVSQPLFAGRSGDSGHARLRQIARAADARLEAIEKSTNGFELAEVDLELRGEGTIMGTRQKGRSDLKLASLRRDKAMVVEARRVATSIVNDDPELANNVELRDEIQLFVDPEEAAFLFKG